MTKLSVTFDIDDSNAELFNDIKVILNVNGATEHPVYTDNTIIPDTGDIDHIFDAMEFLGERFLRYIGAE